MLSDKYEREFCGVVCGVDEAGRGPLVGRVYAAAVILPAFDETQQIFLTPIQHPQGSTIFPFFGLIPRI